MQNQDFNSFLQSSQSQKTMSEIIEAAYAALKKCNWKKVDELLKQIPKDFEDFEYLEIRFLRAHYASSYKYFQVTIFENKYSQESLDILKKMCELCPTKDKHFYISFYGEYKEKLEQFQDDMDVLKKLDKTSSLAERGKLLEEAIKRNPSNLVWYVYMADVKCQIQPSYDCSYEYSCFKKYFNRKQERRKYDYYYEAYARRTVVDYRGRTTVVSCNLLIIRMLQSWFAYSYKYSSLLLLPITIIMGFVCGIKLFIVGCGIVPYVSLGMEIYHIYQLFTLSQRAMFKKVLQAKGEKPILFAQWAYFIQVWEAFKEFMIYGVPLELLGLERFNWSSNWNCIKD